MDNGQRRIDNGQRRIDKGQRRGLPLPYSPRLVMKNLHRSPVSTTVVLGLTLLLAGACGPANDAAAPATPASAAVAASAAASGAAAGNTAAVCEATGVALKDALKLFGTILGAVAKPEETTGDDLTKAYQQTFGTLADRLTAEAAKATDAKLAAALREAADGARKVAATDDIQQADTDFFGEATDKLAAVCPAEKPKPTTPGDPVGAAGSACELPVTFTVAQTWKPKAVEPETGELAELVNKGPMRLACQVDAKPAGMLGFLHVWLGKAAGPREALELFTTDGKTRQVAYTDITVGGRQAVEVRYEKFDKLSEEYTKERAFAVATSAGVFLMELGGLDNEEHEQMTPAYELAKTSLTVS